MVDAAQINKDRIWFNDKISNLIKTFGAEYQKDNHQKYKFLQKMDYIASFLRTSPKDFSDDQARYFHHVRQLFRALYTALSFVSEKYQLNGVQTKILQTAIELAEEMKSVEHLEESKALFNDVCNALNNIHAIRSREEQFAIAK